MCRLIRMGSTQIQSHGAPRVTALWVTAWCYINVRMVSLCVTKRPTGCLDVVKSVHLGLNWNCWKRDYSYIMTLSLNLV